MSMKKSMIVLLVIIFPFIFSGCAGLIPGVDCPINPAAFYNPDIPDYADDGNAFSIKSLSPGMVYDHLRHQKWIANTLEEIKTVSNLYTNIQNQILNLKQIGSSLQGLAAQVDRIKGTAKDLKGIMDINKSAEKAWSEIYKDVNLLESGQTTFNHSDIKTLINQKDKLYKNAINQAASNMDADAVRNMVEQVMDQNDSVEGNNMAKQNSNQVNAIKVSQSIQENQTVATLLATVIADSEMEEQIDANASYNKKGMHIGASDPYHPKEGEPERAKSQGFIKF